MIIVATDVSESPVLIGKQTPAYSLNFVVSHFVVEVPEDVDVVVVPEAVAAVLFVDVVAVVPLVEVEVVEELPEVLQYFVPVGQTIFEQMESSSPVQETAHCVLKFGHCVEYEFGMQAFSEQLSSVLQALVTSTSAPHEDIQVTSRHAAIAGLETKPTVETMARRAIVEIFRRNRFIANKKNDPEKFRTKTAFRR